MNCAGGDAFEFCVLTGRLVESGYLGRSKDMGNVRIGRIVLLQLRL